MADDPAPTFCGKYVWSLYAMGWLTAASGGKLAFVTDAFPLDGSGFFNCYALANGAVVVQAAATRRYLALAPDGVTIVADAATPAAALQLGVVLTNGQFNNTQFFSKTPNGYVCAPGNQGGPALQLGFDGYNGPYSMMCVVPGAPATAGWVWTTFTIMQGAPQYQGTSDLVVYGTMFWMFAPDTTRALQPEPYFAALTTISQNDLAPTTYCPNSRTWATNLANNVPWEAVMLPVSQPVGGSSPLAEA